MQVYRMRYNKINLYLSQRKFHRWHLKLSLPRTNCLVFHMSKRSFTFFNHLDEHLLTKTEVHILYILKRLAGTGWDVSFTTSSSSIIALAYSTADYAASALSYSTLPTLPIQVYSTCQVILPSFAAAYIIWLQQLYHMTAAATSDICDCGPPNITHVNHDSIMYKLPNTVAILTILDNDTIDWLLSDLPV